MASSADTIGRPSIVEEVLASPFFVDTLTQILRRPLPATRGVFPPAVEGMYQRWPGGEDTLRINMVGPASTDRVRNIAAHEVGHAVEQDGVMHSLLRLVRERFPEVQSREGPTSAYARTSPEEQFAEVFMHAIELLQSEPSDYATFASEVLLRDRMLPGVKEAVGELLQHPVYARHWMNIPGTRAERLPTAHATPPRSRR